MSQNNASIFISKLCQRDPAVLAILPKDLALESIGADEIASIAKAADAAAWDFSAEELQEAYLDALNCDDKELAAVAGGITPGSGTSEKAKGPGGCSSNYYAESCEASWETGSDCVCTDFHTGTPI